MSTENTRRNAVSALWASAALNIAFADILSLHTPGVMAEVLTGVVEGVTLSAKLMLIAAMLLQVPIAMIAAMQLLPRRLWRPVNGGAVLVTALFVLGGGSLKPHYVFLAACEVLAMLAILRLVWRNGPRTGTAASAGENAGP